MRIYEGDYAYEIEQAIDPVTRVSTGWRYNVYRVRPQDQLLRSGTAPTKEAAEQAGKEALDEVRKADTKDTSQPAA